MSLLTPLNHFSGVLQQRYYTRGLTSQLLWLLAKDLYVGKEAKDAFKDAFVNFSRWVSMDGISSPRMHEEVDATSLAPYKRDAVLPLPTVVDKTIPIYFKENKPLRKGCSHADNLSRVSQIFISDTAGRSSDQSALHEITRSDASINCSPPLPWVAILVDFGVKIHAVQPTFSVGQSEPRDIQEVGPCLRIHVTAISVDTFPFLSRHERLRSVLQNIIVYEELSSERWKAYTDISSNKCCMEVLVRNVI
ncbi:hypothetical protein EDC04DRAFT_3149750 [Pisolithus marmoratus]|nr:hypothetical protein EDC04DRAFT_3149750 [Pisolithus marmoratus]